MKTGVFLHEVAIWITHTGSVSVHILLVGPLSMSNLTPWAPSAGPLPALSIFTPKASDGCFHKNHLMNYMASGFQICIRTEPRFMKQSKRKIGQNSYPLMKWSQTFSWQRSLDPHLIWFCFKNLYLIRFSSQIWLRPEFCSCQRQSVTCRGNENYDQNSHSYDSYWHWAHLCSELNSKKWSIPDFSGDPWNSLKDIAGIPRYNKWVTIMLKCWYVGRSIM